jgi:membrane-bound metal-dependent hydrolase YbcI (DUF457 family)
MFIGHTAVALAAKKATPKVSLGVLLGAAIWLDLVWPLFLLLGIERVRIAPGNTAFTPLEFTSYPWTHSLVMALVWSIVFAAFSAFIIRDWRVWLMLGALVFSHWALDFIVHRPDLPLLPSESPKVGLGLWNSIPGTLVIEGAMLVAGLWLYLGATKPRDAIGRYGFWGLIVLYGVLWLANLMSPPPPDMRSLAWFAMAGWLLPVWAWWADRHRIVTAPVSNTS